MASTIKALSGACLCHGHENTLSIYKPSNATIFGRLFAGTHSSKQISMNLLPWQWKNQLTTNSREDKWRTHCQNADESLPVVPPDSSDVPLVSLNASPQFNLIQRFYDAINHKDVGSLNELIAEDCIFMDFIFYMPHGGRQSIINFLCDVMDAMGSNIRLSVDEMKMLDERTTTVTWHLDWKAQEIPFTTSCTVFNCEETGGKILFRKIIGLQELPLKPGELVLKLLKATGTLLDNFPGAAEVLLQKSRGELRVLLEFLGIKPKC